MVTESKIETEPKVEVPGQRNYELAVIVHPEVPEEKLETIVQGISKLITDREGTVAGVDRWGKKRLAYPIKHVLEGQYVLTRFAIKPALCKELEANLRISEDVIRYLLIELD